MTVVHRATSGFNALRKRKIEQQSTVEEAMAMIYRFSGTIEARGLDDPNLGHQQQSVEFLTSYRIRTLMLRPSIGYLPHRLPSRPDQDRRCCGDCFLFHFSAPEKKASGTIVQPPQRAWSANQLCIPRTISADIHRRWRYPVILQMAANSLFRILFSLAIHFGLVPLVLGLGSQAIASTGVSTHVLPSAIKTCEGQNKEA